MTQATMPTGLFYDFFSPLPAQAESPKKDALDHIVDYTDSTSGAWDVFRIGNYVFSALHSYLDPSHRLSDLAGKAKEVFDSAGMALSIPQLFSDVNSLRKSITQLFTVQDVPYSDPLRTRKIAQAAKKGFLDSVTLTNTASQIAIFADNVKIFAIEAARLSLLNTIYDITGAIGDGAELLGEYGKLKHYQVPAARTRSQAEVTKLEEKQTLALLHIAKDIASLALAAISLTAALYGVAVSSIFALSTATLVISALWLTMKVTAHFYDKVIVEAPPPLLRSTT